MATLAVQQIDTDGLKAVYSACSAGGDTFPNGDRVLVHVKNGDSTDHTVTVPAQVSQVTLSPYGVIALADLVIPVVQAEDEFFVVPRGSQGGNPTLTYDAVTSMTIAVMRLPRGL